MVTAEWVKRFSTCFSYSFASDQNGCQCCKSAPTCKWKKVGIKTKYLHERSNLDDHSHACTLSHGIINPVSELCCFITWLLIMTEIKNHVLCTKEHVRFFNGGGGGEKCGRNVRS